MKLTIAEKAETAIGKLNQAAILMHRQMKSGELDKAAVDDLVSEAQKKANDFRDTYFSQKKLSPEELRQRAEFDGSELFADFNQAYYEFDKMLKQYAQAFGVEFREK